MPPRKSSRDRQKPITARQAAAAAEAAKKEASKKSAVKKPAPKKSVLKRPAAKSISVEKITTSILRNLQATIKLTDDFREFIQTIADMPDDEELEDARGDLDHHMASMLTTVKPTVSEGWARKRREAEEGNSKKKGTGSRSCGFKAPKSGKGKNSKSTKTVVVEPEEEDDDEGEDEEEDEDEDEVEDEDDEEDGDGGLDHRGGRRHQESITL